MKTETITQKLLRRLDESAGKHCKIAREVGIGQATISRIYQRKVSPSLRNVEALIAWFDAEEAKESASTPPPNKARPRPQNSVGCNRGLHSVTQTGAR